MLYNHTRSPQNLLAEGVSRPLLAITTVEKPLSAALVRRTGQCHLELTLLELSAGSLNACVIAKIICLLKIAHYSSTAQEITKNVTVSSPPPLWEMASHTPSHHHQYLKVWCWPKSPRCWKGSFDSCLPYCFRKTSNRINWDLHIFADMIIQKIVLPGFLIVVIHKSLVGQQSGNNMWHSGKATVLAILKQSLKQKNFQEQKQG